MSNIHFMLVEAQAWQTCCTRPVAHVALIKILNFGANVFRFDSNSAKRHVPSRRLDFFLRSTRKRKSATKVANLVLKK